MKHTRLPWWVIEEHLRAAEQALSGKLDFEYESGRPRKVLRTEVIAPTKEAIDADGSAEAPGLPLLPPQLCPEDGAPMAESDYGNKFTCVQCKRVWTVWDLRKMRKLRGSDGEVRDEVDAKAR